MITKLKRMILTAAAVVALGAPALVPAAVYAESATQPGLQCGAKLEIPESGTITENSCPIEGDNTGSLNDLIATVINIFSVIVGVVAVIMIILGGLKYITSGGDSGNVSGAKNTIIYAVVGLVVVALAQFVVRFVLNQTSGFGAN